MRSKKFKRDLLVVGGKRLHIDYPFQRRSKDGGGSVKISLSVPMTLKQSLTNKAQPDDVVR